MPRSLRVLARAMTVGSVIVASIFARGVAVAQSAVDPCSLLTRSEIRRVVHVSVGKGTAARGPIADRCRWDTNGGLLKSGSNFSLALEQGPNAAADFDQSRQGSLQIPGVGDDAYYFDRSLGVLKGGSFFSVVFTQGRIGRKTLSDSVLQSKLLPLARKAAARL